MLHLRTQQLQLLHKHFSLPSNLCHLNKHSPDTPGPGNKTDTLPLFQTSKTE